MTLLVCVRHGPPLAKGICYGRSDVDTSLPQVALQKLSVRLQEITQARRARLWVSPAQRCRKVAAVLADQLALEATVDSRLQELSFGAWEGRPWKELEALAEFESWMNHWRDEAPPQGETLSELASRVDEWRRTLRDFDVHIAVTHAGVIRQLQVFLRGASWEHALNSSVPYLTPIEFSGIEP